MISSARTPSRATPLKVMVLIIVLLVIGCCLLAFRYLRVRYMYTNTGPLSLEVLPPILLEAMPVEGESLSCVLTLRNRSRFPVVIRDLTVFPAESLDYTWVFPESPIPIAGLVIPGLEETSIELVFAIRQTPSGFMDTFLLGVGQVLSFL
jgi:hypothetical protein